MNFLKRPIPLCFKKRKKKLPKLIFSLSLFSVRILEYVTLCVSPARRPRFESTSLARRAYLYESCVRLFAISKTAQNNTYAYGRRYVGLRKCEGGGMRKNIIKSSTKEKIVEETGCFFFFSYIFCES